MIGLSWGAGRRLTRSHEDAKDHEAGSGKRGDPDE
jgi:hypothetical protein